MGSESLSVPTVVSLGGNAILAEGRAGTIEEQCAVTTETMRHVLRLIIDGYQIVLTHGNGPIVGNIMILNEAAKRLVPPMPLDVCGADSQGGIGYMIQQSLGNLMQEAGLKQKRVVTLITQVVVHLDEAIQVELMAQR